MTIPELHDTTVCPGCATGHPCRVLTAGHLRYWTNYRESPALWGPVLTRDAMLDAGQAVEPLQAPESPTRPVEAPSEVYASTARYGQAVALVEACPHRSNVQEGCRCTADCGRLGRRVTRKECTDCQIQTLESLASPG